MERTKDQLYTAQEILGTLVEHREKLEALGVRKIGLFGSYVRGEATLESDMDFLVDLDAETWHEYTSVLFYLEDLFGCEIDLVMSDALKPRLRPYILGEVVYAAA
jgi:uncharacterized protein